MTTRFLYDSADAIGEYDAGGALLRRYVHGPGLDEPIVWYEGAGTGDRRWLHADQLGSVIAVSNASGAMLTINAYDEYGAPSSSNAGRFQYTGQMWLPEAGLYHYKARAYAPSLGRFLQSDPILYAGGINLYAYVANDPVNATDPWGLCDNPMPDGGGRPCEDDPPIVITAPNTVNGLPVSDTWQLHVPGSNAQPASPYSPYVRTEWDEVPIEIFAEPKPRRQAPPPRVPWWLLRASGWGAAVTWVLWPAETAMDDCTTMPQGCPTSASQSQPPLGPPDMTTIDPRQETRRDYCIRVCTNLALPTPDYGVSFQRCVNQCMGTNDYPEWRRHFPRN